jgi:hypothetical protein
MYIEYTLWIFQSTLMVTSMSDFTYLKQTCKYNESETWSKYDNYY